MITSYDGVNLFIVCFIVMLWSCYKYPTNYWLNAFWLITIPWLGVDNVLISEPPPPDEIIYDIVVLMLFSCLLQIFYLQQQLRTIRKNRK